MDLKTEAPKGQSPEPPRKPHEISDDREAIRQEMKKSRVRHTQRVQSKLP